ncbi:MAG: hypothetical protein S0880_04285 [Actinomycetota bacterium]|nr:hypothetical protein [Actinomycetota bacterium]
MAALAAGVTPGDLALPARGHDTTLDGSGVLRRAPHLDDRFAVGWQADDGRCVLVSGGSSVVVLPDGQRIHLAVAPDLPHRWQARGVLCALGLPPESGARVHGRATPPPPAPNTLWIEDEPTTDWALEAGSPVLDDDAVPLLLADGPAPVQIHLEASLDRTGIIRTLRSRQPPPPPPTLVATTIVARTAYLLGREGLLRERTLHRPGAEPVIAEREVAVWRIWRPYTYRDSLGVRAVIDGVTFSIIDEPHRPVIAHLPDRTRHWAAVPGPATSMEAPPAMLAPAVAAAVDGAEQLIDGFRSH